MKITLGLCEFGHLGLDWSDVVQWFIIVIVGFSQVRDDSFFNVLKIVTNLLTVFTVDDDQILTQTFSCPQSWQLTNRKLPLPHESHKACPSMNRSFSLAVPVWSRGYLYLSVLLSDRCHKKHPPPRGQNLFQFHLCVQVSCVDQLRNLFSLSDSERILAPEKFRPRRT